MKAASQQRIARAFVKLAEAILCVECREFDDDAVELDRARKILENAGVDLGKVFVESVVDQRKAAP